MTHLDLRYLTSAEAASPGGEAVGLIQVGALEQHGPHLPLGTDSAITDAVVRAAAERLEQPLLVAPMIEVGRSDHHLGFPGTISVPEAAFQELLAAHARAFAALGIVRVALFSAHAGNFAALRAFGENGDHGGLDVRAYGDAKRFLEVLAQAGTEAGLDAPATDSHAGAYETSLVLSLLGEERVREFEAVEGYVAAEPGWLESLESDGIERLSGIGVLGRPRGANAEAGARILAALAGELVDWLSESFGLAEVRPPPPPAN